MKSSNQVSFTQESPSEQERSAIMKSSNPTPRCGFSRWWVPAFVLALSLTACDGGGNGNDGVDPPPATGTVFEAPPTTARTAIGAVDTGEATPQAVAPGTVMTLDGGTTPVPLGPEGQFEIRDLADGNHSLFLQQADGTVVEIPFRMLEGRSLSLGTVQVREGVFQHSGFNGLRFGFVDANNDGINDLFADANGDGIGDAGLYADYPYFMGHGWVDDNNDGINDRFVDADGDGSNDVAGGPAGPGFGFLDDNGDGIADDTGMPFRHPFGFLDANDDGFNDRFRDTDGDGLNDITGAPYIGMPGWADLDGDGNNDFFRDTNGDGLNDVTGANDVIGAPFGHGFGWIDIDGNGINDRFQDAQGDGVNDVAQGPFAGLPFHIGFVRGHVDANGDGIDDTTELPYHHGFGWVDLNGDGINDAFADGEGDGVNDITGHHYEGGFVPGPGGTQGGHIDPGDWPMGPGQGGGGMR